MKLSNLTKLVIFCIALLLIRVLKTHHFSFFFLMWNLFLAWLPYWIIKNYKKAKNKYTQFSLIGLCILFLPNAPYILTDLFHLTKNLVAPIWFDLILIMSFALIGLILFILATERLFEILGAFFKSRVLFSFVRFLIILSNGYGIYLGRYLRFNSWDIISNPDELVLRMFHSVFDQDHYKETIAVTFTFTIFLYLVFEIYESFKKGIGEKHNELS